MLYRFLTFVLVPCAPGRYYRNDECVKCDFGTYQDLSAQLSCKHCPDGTTTPGRESRSVTECSIKYDTELNGTQIIFLYLSNDIIYVFPNFSYKFYNILYHFVSESISIIVGTVISGLLLATLVFLVLFRRCL